MTHAKRAGEKGHSGFSDSRVQQQHSQAQHQSRLEGTCLKPWKETGTPGVSINAKLSETILAAKQSLLVHPNEIVQKP